MKPWWLSVVGTDTGVGKTRAADAARRYFAQGRRIAAIKPFVTGGEHGSWEDLSILDPEAEYRTPARYQRPLSPYGAIRRGEREVPVAVVEEYLDGIAVRNLDGVIIEGIGGIFVPVDRNELWIDLHARRAWPALLVARAGLGTINHTLLTLEALKTRSVDVIGFVLSATGPLQRLDAEENAAMISERSGIESLGIVDYDPKCGGAWDKAVNWSRVEERICRKSK